MLIIEKPRFEGTDKERIAQMEKFIYILIDTLNTIHLELEEVANDGK